MKRIIDLSIDIETASTASNAAILSIAAIPFCKHEEGDCIGIVTENGLEKVSPYYEIVNATSCVMAGMDFDKDTINFWKNQPAEAKAEFFKHESRSITDVMEGFVKYCNYIKDKYDAELILWCQGLDFDIPILRNAIKTAIGQEELPWKYNAVRCSRTKVLEVIDDLFPQEEDPYNLLPQLPFNKEHNGLYDALRSALNVNTVSVLLRQTSVDIYRALQTWKVLKEKEYNNYSSLFD